MAKISEPVNEKPVEPETVPAPPASVASAPAYPYPAWGRYPLRGRPIGLGVVTAFIVILAFLLGVLVGGFGGHESGHSHHYYGPVQNGHSFIQQGQHGTFGVPNGFGQNSTTGSGSSSSNGVNGGGTRQGQGGNSSPSTVAPSANN